MSERPLRLAIVGMGKMGRAIEQLAPDRSFEVVARIDPVGGASRIDRDSLAGADVAVEFTVPDAAVDNIAALVDAGCPVVVGTTGWYSRLGEVREHVDRSGGAVLYAPNFSIGVNLFAEIAAAAARLMKGTSFDVHLVETHHTAKKDAPSGTAALLADIVARRLGGEVPVTSVRTGSVPGTHEIVFDAPFETIRLEHSARDRRVFADGALAAARWLHGRRGIFTMSDVLSTESER